jgi:hypothetical protein
LKKKGVVIGVLIAAVLVAVVAVVLVRAKRAPWDAAAKLQACLERKEQDRREHGGKSEMKCLAEVDAYLKLCGQAQSKGDCAASAQALLEAVKKK